MSNCRIPSSEPGISDVGLGKYIDGYDSHYDSLPWGALIVPSLFGLSIFILGVMVICSNPSQSGFSIIFFLFASPFIAWAANVFIKRFLRRTQVFVYEYGFIWELAKRNGDTIKRDKIDFREIDGIELPKTRTYTNGIYSGTSFVLTIWSKSNEVLKVSGTYKNQYEDEEKGGWTFLSLKAIMNQWNRLGLIRINKELEKNGFVCFFDRKHSERIEVGRDYISVDAKTIKRENIQYSFIEGKLYIYDAQKKKKFFRQSDITIDVNSLTNGQLFLFTVSSLLNIR